MSTRHLRKILGHPSIPPPEDSDEEFEPFYTQSKASFSCLDLEDGMNNDSTSEKNEDSDEEPYSSIVVKKKDKKKNKKKKNRQAKTVKCSGSQPEDDKMDEVERSIREVNAILGEAKLEPSTSEPLQVQKSVMAINPRHLDQNYEMERLFGPEEMEKGKKKKTPNYNRLLRKPVIVSFDPYPEFSNKGITMSVLRTEGGVTYFSIDHDQRYQQFHQVVLSLLQNESRNADPVHLYLQVANGKRISFDTCLRVCDILFDREEHSLASNQLELLIVYLQSIAHPGFNFSSLSIRLEYKILENQPFHHALLKYMHFLTNKALHRTALEIAKVLINLDPSDPLAVRLFIDSIAIRAREHQWLIEAIDQWDKESNAKMLFNIQYTYALANFHVLRKKKEDIAPATQLLRKAILNFPAVVPTLLSMINQKVHQNLQERALFKAVVQKWTTMALRQLCSVFAKFVGPRWREPAVASWLADTAATIADDYDRDVNLQREAVENGHKNLQVFRALPKEARRHFHQVRYMTKLIVDDVFEAVRPVWETGGPMSNEGMVDRYGYLRRTNLNFPTASVLQQLGLDYEPAVMAGAQEANPDFRIFLQIMDNAMETLARVRGQDNQEPPQEPDPH